MNEGVDRRELDAFQRSLRAYLRWNQRETGPLIENRANRLRWTIYKAFKAIAPTRDQVDQEAASLDYQIKRGLTEDGKRRTVRQELAARKKSIRFLSVSWLFRAWKLAREGQRTRADSRSRHGQQIGAAKVNTGKGTRNPFVLIESYLEGVKTKDRERGIISAALRHETNDMKAYLRRKQVEAWNRLLESS